MRKLLACLTNHSSPSFFLARARGVRNTRSDHTNIVENTVIAAIHDVNRWIDVWMRVTWYVVPAAPNDSFSSSVFVAADVTVSPS